MNNDFVWLPSLYSDPEVFTYLEPFMLRNSLSSRCMHSLANNPGSFAIGEALGHVSRFAGAFLVWLSRTSSFNVACSLRGSPPPPPPPRFGSAQVKAVATNVSLFGFPFRSKRKSFASVKLGKISSLAMKMIWSEAKRLRSLPILSLAAALVPPFQNLSSNVLASPLQSPDMQMYGTIDQVPKEVECQGCPFLSYLELNQSKPAVEPKTGIEFPLVLDNIFAGEKDFGFNSEVLVGTGSRTMTIVKIKSLKVYAFGVYIHPYSLCKKLGPKYASISADELNNHQDFYQDLLREDINMTVRLVVNCRGMKINSVRNAFEKSLRARLVKTNPSTDFHCLETFGSYFEENISIPLGTVIEFKQTVDGRLITKIGDNQIGSVHSKDLCRAFFDMYIGDVPVCEETKKEIGTNIASIIRRC
ncbi:hypothetical protein LR48_Vigan07g254900 [Vigna angularis]|uniref:Fatty-acid-binding protein n=2 Tax=Phaseolus angularis TaxID=3914 RepID=A0A0L9V133_PHAAN|nr:fatty-acid-binding protein 2 isoform X1 [Vigna angularis]KAG2390207.1 Fatty-acid-binding protein [Vigna angularis]KOM48845.1 hypothetical protein LR48_Vigan07g254900 [Vigna angularis]BAT82486.1 hypothetical protein VIGAN_03251400 [Vigna angularis var. angularis]